MGVAKVKRPIFKFWGPYSIFGTGELDISNLECTLIMVRLAHA